MIEKFFAIFSIFCALTTCAYSSRRYSTSMQDAMELPNDINTSHTMIREQTAMIGQQSATIAELVTDRDKLRQEVAELELAFKRMLLGKRREKFIDPRQALIQFPDDPELQEALEEAKREAAKVVEMITVERKKANAAKPKRSESFPDHLRREDVNVPVPEEQQKLIDEGKLKIIRDEIREMLKFKRPELYVIRYHQPVLAYVDAPEQGIITVERPAGIGDEGRYDATVD